MHHRYEIEEIERAIIQKTCELMDQSGYWLRLDALFSVDEEHDVVCDHSDNDDINPIMDEIQKFSDSFLSDSEKSALHITINVV